MWSDSETSWREGSQRSTVLLLREPKGSQVWTLRWTDGKWVWGGKKMTECMLGRKGARASPPLTVDPGPTLDTRLTTQQTSANPIHSFITMAPHQTATCHPTQLLGGSGAQKYSANWLDAAWWAQRLAPLQPRACVTHCLISNKVPSAAQAEKLACRRHLRKTTNFALNKEGKKGLIVGVKLFPWLIFFK